MYSARSSGRRGTILIVEDSQVQAELLRRTLHQNGYVPTVAHDGRAALVAVRRRRPDLVLTDIEMPNLDGYELCRAMKQDPDLADIPVVLLTSHMTVKDAFRGLEAGADDYIGKPWEERELLRRVELLLGMEVTGRETESLNLSFQGVPYAVYSGRRQISALLMSVLEEAVRRNDELEKHRRELHEANQLLKKTNTQLEQASRSKDDFLAKMSHELRTPLHSILGFSEVMLDNAALPEETRVRFLGHIQGAGRHLLELINDILDLSKVGAGRLDLHAEEFDARESIYAVHETVRPMAEQKEQILVLEIDPSVGLLVQDPRRFTQILYNLLSNAIKFTPDGGRIITRARMIDGSLEVSVIDTGIGIQPEELGKIFDEFQQVDSGYARTQQGTGLGLALVRRFLELMKGEIRVDSKYGEGSTFSFRLPVRPSEGS